MMRKTRGTVARDLTAVVISGHCMPARIVLRYRRDDAFAVTLRVRPGQGDPGGGADSWMLARELLHRGLTRPAGEGEVRIRPLSADWTVLELGDCERPVLLVVATADLRGFLDASFALVPVGEEAATIDWAALAGVLDAGPPES